MNKISFFVTKVDNGFVVTMPVQEKRTKLGERPKFKTTLICKEVKEVNDLFKQFAETNFTSNDGMYLASAEPLHDLEADL